jgi:hypothetical protein
MMANIEIKPTTGLGPQTGKVVALAARDLWQGMTAPLLEYGCFDGAICSAGGYELPFSTPRALARNCLIHAMGEKTLVAQCAEGTGGTWSGSQWNLRRGMSELYVFDDGSAASAALQSCGAERLPDIPASLALLRPFQLSIFDGKSDEKRKK